MNYYIVTGASRGIGEAIVRNLMRKTNSLICTSRSKNQSIIQAFKEMNIPLVYLNIDLSDVETIHDFLDQLFSSIDVEKAESITLINNAGVVKPIKPIEKCNTTEILDHLHLNLAAPMVLTSAFIQRFQDVNVKKNIVNISSGAAKRSLYGWSIYCSAKAGLDSFTKTVALEQERKNTPIKVISFAPGVVDTEMQTEIRSTNPEDFVDVEAFKKLKEKNELLTTNEVAYKLLNLLQTDVVQGGIYHVREL